MPNNPVPNGTRGVKMIEVKDLSYKYKNGEQVLEDVNLQINEGEVVCIIGKNGSGKSTLARLLSGITKPSSGEIKIDGINTKNKDKFIELRKLVRNCIPKSRKSDNIQ